jgi:cytochrome b involved in lipid metabolism
MTAELDQLIARAKRQQRQNGSRVQRLISLLDLTPPLDEQALREAVREEMQDQHDMLITALSGMAAGEPALALVRDHPADIPAQALRDMLPELAPACRAAVEQALSRHERFQERLGWLLQPDTYEQVQRLDPVRDATRIYHYVSYEFRAEQKLFAVLFETRPLLLPANAMFFHSTGEFIHRAFQRINDTVMFFSNMLEWGLESKRGREAVARVNAIHGRYAAPNDAFRFILGGLMFVPVLWNQKLGWRPFTEVERLGWFNAFAQMGRAMNIRGISDDYDTEFAWWREMSSCAGGTTDATQRAFVEIVIQVLATYQSDLRIPILSAIVAGMDDWQREAMDLPPAPAAVVAEVRQVLKVIGQTTATLPRTPWIRSLQPYPLYYKLDEIGVAQRSVFLPAKHQDTRPAQERLPLNGDYPQGLCPFVDASEVPATELPEVTLEEVATHNQAQDAWIVIDGVVYDVTRFLYEHPGGARPLMPWLGRDATQAFLRVGHSRAAEILMANFRVARLPGVTRTTPPAQGPQIRRAKRAGDGKAYTDADFYALASAMTQWISEFESKRGDQEPDSGFPIRLPMDPRPETHCLRPPR